MNIEYECEVTCPSCFESFSVTSPAPNELPAVWDYDCEVCCRPMEIHFSLEDSEIIARAESIDGME
ncbi:MAG: CPXCG motif-containing cysteine-rich protein [Verrucomicrobiota bacterium]